MNTRIRKSRISEGRDGPDPARPPAGRRGLGLAQVWEDAQTAVALERQARPALQPVAATNRKVVFSHD